jgi:hypothetical protein
VLVGLDFRWAERKEIVKFAVGLHGKAGELGVEMQSSNGGRSQTQLDTNSSEREWREFLELNSNAMFQVALLLSADVYTAEAALLNSIDELEIRRAPRKGDLAAWQHAVVARSIATRTTEKSGVDLLYRSMLQPGLWPVMQIERLPRTCFVLRLLLGYPRSACAQLLGIEESKIETLLATAIDTLQPSNTEAH